MFSLIITVIAIALVALLAVATILYVKPTIEAAQARAKAATLINQATQVDGALQLFRQDKGRWPTSTNELITGEYLRTVPISPTRQQVALLAPLHAFLPTAHAADGKPWAQVVTGTPQFWVLRAVPKAVCQSINLQIRGDNGIHNAAIPGVKMQCFGQNESYTMLLHYGATDAASIAETVPDHGGVPTLLVDEDGGGWSVAPTITGAVPPSGGTTPTPSPTTPTTPEGPVTPAPVISSLSPATGSADGGTMVTIVGSNFQSGAQVTVGGVTVPATFSSPTQLTFFTPEGTEGKVPVVVTSGGKPSASAEFTYTAGLALNSITPSFGPVAGGTNVTLTGSNFQPGTKVSMGGKDVAVTIVDSTRLTFTTPAGTAGEFDITVTLNGKTTSPLKFTYVAPVGGRVTTLYTGYIPGNRANVAADATGFYALSGRNFYRTSYAGVTTTLKTTGWSHPCAAESGIQPVAWTLLTNGDLAAIANCDNGGGFAFRMTNTGVQLGSYKNATGLHSALTAGGQNNYFYNTSSGEPYTRTIRGEAADGSFNGASWSGGPDTTGMAADPTEPYVYYVHLSTPTNMALNRCAIGGQYCTAMAIGLMDYPANTSGIAISSKPYLAFDGNGQLYAASPTAIYKVDKATGAWAVYAGKPGTAGTVDGMGGDVRLSIRSIGRSTDGKIYIHDEGSGSTTNTIRRLD